MALFWSLLLNYILLIRKKLFPLLTNILQWHTEYFCMLFKTENGVSSSNNCMYIIYYKKLSTKKRYNINILNLSLWLFTKKKNHNNKIKLYINYILHSDIGHNFLWSVFMLLKMKQETIGLKKKPWNLLAVHMLNVHKATWTSVFILGSDLLPLIFLITA